MCYDLLAIATNVAQEVDLDISVDDERSVHGTHRPDQDVAEQLSLAVETLGELETGHDLGPAH